MAPSQQPLKVPTKNWPSSPFQMVPMAATATATAAASQHNSWVEEFLDFSSARRNAHRRSATGPIAFVEAPLERGNDSNVSCNIENCGFERLDDEQLRTMFSDDVVPAIIGGQTMLSSDPSTPSDQNSGNQEMMPAPPDDAKLLPKCEPEEVVDSSCQSVMNSQAEINPSAIASTDSLVDPKRIKRILANRQSAQRSRVRKLQYISELERRVTTLQTEVSALSPMVVFLDHQRLILNVDNSVLKQRIAALAQDKIFKDAHQEALRKEIERLRQMYHEQSMKKVPNEATNEASQSQK